jgi:hypothetical protein
MNETASGHAEQGEGADRLHDRAAQSASEKRKVILSVSSGAVGIFFLALTGRVDPAFTPFQRSGLG